MQKISLENWIHKILEHPTSTVEADKINGSTYTELLQQEHCNILRNNILASYDEDEWFSNNGVL